MRYVVGLILLILALPEFVIRVPVAIVWTVLIAILALIGFWKPDDEVPLVHVRPSCLGMAERLLTP